MNLLLCASYTLSTNTVHLPTIAQAPQMIKEINQTAAATQSSGKHWWRTLVPLVVMATIALFPAPAGCAPHAWYYFAIFAGVITALVVEPLPGAAIGFIAVTLVMVLARWVLFSPAELAKPEFKLAASSLEWALTGFSNSTIWLIFTAFLFALGYEKTGLGRRLALMLVKALGKRTLTLGYACVLTDAILAPFTPSNTARSAGTIFPLVRNLPLLFGSEPNTPSARKIGGYLMWTTFAATSVTSSLFLTACAPNLLATEIARKILNVDITWKQWFFASAPFALPLLLALPILVYVFYPPQIKQGREVSDWATGELKTMGRFSTREIQMALLVLLAIVLWIFGGRFVEATTGAFIVVSLMLILGIVSWNDLVRNHAAWTTLTTFATLVTLAGGLARTGFIKWFADNIAGRMGRLFADRRASCSDERVFFSALHFCQSHRPHDGVAAGDAGCGRGDSWHAARQAGHIAGLDNGHYGRYYAVRYGAGLRVL